MVIKKKRQSEIAAFLQCFVRVACLFKHAMEYYSAADSSALSNVL